MSNTSLLATAETSSLVIGYEFSGNPDGFPVLLMHGWPDDVRTWDGILPALHQANYRTIVPYLRGFGRTRFRNSNVRRSGQLAALGQDVIDLADAMGLERFAVVGHDWGARAAYIASCLDGGERISHCVALSVGWGTNDPSQSLGLRQIQNYWYHWYMTIDRGEALVRNDRRAFTRHIWNIWNPSWAFSDAEFERTAASFDNPDWADVVLHSYRVRWGLAPTDPALANIERRLTQRPEISVPTMVIHGGADPCNDPSTSEGKEQFFTGPYRRFVVDGAGHFPQREAPTVVANALVPFLSGNNLGAS
ncbi:alpha/beta fold hydrolase [Mesorhizobium shangrilense]|uniref:Alpha/beta hydrolase n=1 Tax=Mesorhizobium shangrilense TaxID=460060 RepID=A0ABV2DGU7_9HYPH